MRETLLGAAERERTRSELARAEAILVRLRWFGMAAFVPILIGAEKPLGAVVAWSALAASVAYTAYSQWRVSARKDIRATALLTTVGDACTVLVICFVSGGIASPFYGFFFATVLGASLRFGLGQTFLTLLVNGSLSLVLFFFAPGAPVSWRALGVRLFYLVFIALMGGSLSQAAKRHSRQALREGDKASLLLSVSRGITGTLDLAELPERILRALAGALACRGAFMALLDPSGRGVERVAATSPRVEPDPRAVEQALAAGRLRRALDEKAALLEPESAEALGLETGRQVAVVLAPIRRRELRGLLGIVCDGSIALSPDDRSVLSAVADQAAVAIENARLVDDVRQARDRHQELAWRLIRAGEEERKRLAGEIHDHLGGKLFEVYQGIDRRRAELPASDEASRRLLETLAREARDCAEEVRNFTTELRPQVLDDFGFGEALREYVALLRAREPFRIETRIETEAASLPPEVHVMLFRVLQEALLNVRKHAGATSVEIALSTDAAGGVSLRVRDDGRGFDPEQTGGQQLGLLYIRERAEACGGSVRISSRPGDGTELEVVIPAVEPHPIG